MYLSQKDPCNSCLVVCTGHGWQERPRILRFSVIGVRKLSGCWMLVTAGKLATDVNSTMSILRFVEQHGRFHGHVDANSHFPGLCFVPQQRTQLARLAEGRLEMQILHQGCELFSASPIDYHRLSSFQNIQDDVSIISQNFNVSVIELDDGKIYRKALYLMVKTMVSCKFSLKPIQWFCSSWVEWSSFDNLHDWLPWGATESGLFLSAGIITGLHLDPFVEFGWCFRKRNSPKITKNHYH